MKEVIAYLNFDGDCREAMQFYAKCLGAEVQIAPFSETDDRVMHARLSKGSSTLLMASDIQRGMKLDRGNNVSISVHCESRPEIQSFFASVGDGGTVTMPLQDTFWGATFGMLTDRYGIRWMFNFEHPKKATA